MTTHTCSEVVSRECGGGSDENLLIWECAMRAADTVAPNLPPRPEERLRTSKTKPLAHWKYCRRGRNAVPFRYQARAGGHFIVVYGPSGPFSFVCITFVDRRNIIQCETSRVHAFDDDSIFAAGSFSSTFFLKSCAPQYSLSAAQPRNLRNTYMKHDQRTSLPSPKNACWPRIASKRERCGVCSEIKLCSRARS